MSKEYYTIIRDIMDSQITSIRICQKRKIALLLIRSVKRINVYEIYSKMANGWRMKGMEK